MPSNFSILVRNTKSAVFGDGYTNQNKDVVPLEFFVQFQIKIDTDFYILSSNNKTPSEDDIYHGNLTFSYITGSNK